MLILKFNMGDLEAWPNTTNASAVTS